jgi:hypothetical protein
MADIALAQTPEPRQGFRVGDTVHVYMGTSAGVRAHRTVAFIGTVVGFHEEERKWLVRNNILAKKGKPNLVDEAFMSRYTCPTALLILFSSLLFSSLLFSSLLLTSNRL